MPIILDALEFFVLVRKASSRYRLVVLWTCVVVVTQFLVRQHRTRRCVFGNVEQFVSNNVLSMVVAGCAGSLHRNTSREKKSSIALVSLVIPFSH